MMNYDLSIGPGFLLGRRLLPSLLDEISIKSGDSCHVWFGAPSQGEHWANNRIKEFRQTINSWVALNGTR